MKLAWISEVLHDIIDKGGYVGTILATLALLCFIAAHYGLLPKFTRRASFVLTILVILLLFVALLLPVYERRALGVQTVDVILQNDANELVPLEFTLKYRIPDRGVQNEEGHEGVAEVRGVPVGIERLNIVDVELAGWSMRDRGPFPINDGEVNIVLVKDQPAPPLDDARRPDPSVSIPPTQELTKEPSVEPGKVTLHYKNLTGRPLVLVLYPYSIKKEVDLWDIKSKWLDFPMEDERDFYDRFKSGNGWFGIWVRDVQEKYWPLGSHNLFVAQQVWLTVEKTDSDDERPYQIRIEEDEASSE